MILEQALARHPGAETFRKERATRSGRFDAVPSKRDIVLDWEGSPALVPRTVDPVETTWAGRTEDRALMAGEDDWLESWCVDTRLGIVDPDMTLLCEPFELIDILGQPLTAVVETAFTTESCPRASEGAEGLPVAMIAGEPRDAMRRFRKDVRTRGAAMTWQQALARNPGFGTGLLGHDAAISTVSMRAGEKWAMFVDPGPAEAAPRPGRRENVLNWNGTMALVLRTAERREIRDCDMGCLQSVKATRLPRRRPSSGGPAGGRGLFNRHDAGLETLRAAGGGKVGGRFPAVRTDWHCGFAHECEGAIMVGDGLVRRGVTAWWRRHGPDTGGVLVEGELKASLQSQAGAELTFERGQDVH